MFCATIFDRSLFPQHTRAKKNALIVRGVVLDIENGDVTPDDFSNVFPDTECIFYSSFSHTPSEPRFRICIPTTHYMDAETSTLVRNIIKHRLEKNGFGGQKAPGRKHGIDTGNLHEASMFYWPSQTRHAFLTHFCDNRLPLNPFDWVGECPDELIAPVPPPAIPYVEPDFSVQHKDSRVQKAIEYWHENGCTKGDGRTQLWLLAKRLAEAGCDASERQSILWCEAAYATNPNERRAEIPELLF